MTLFKDQCTLMVTSVDIHFPYCIALCLLECFKGPSSKIRFVATAQDISNELVQNLKKKGAEIREICYGDRQSVENAVRGVNVMVFFPEHDENRVTQARELADAARNEENLCGVLVTSIQGAGDGKQRVFKDYCEIEKIWKRELKSSETCLCVLRPAFLQDAMRLWSPHVEDSGTFNMTPSSNKRFAPLALNDYARVVYGILAKAHDKAVIQIDRKHHNKCYTLTGPESISMREMVDIVNDAIGDQGRVEYERVNEEELREYLENLSYDLQKRDGSVLHGLKKSNQAITKLIDRPHTKVDKHVRKFFEGLDRAEDAIRRLDGRNRGRQFNNGSRYNSRRQQKGLQARRIYDVIDMLDRLRNSGIEDADRLNTNERIRLANDVKRELNRIVEKLRDSELEGEGRHEHKFPPIPLPLRPVEVNCVLDYLRYIEEGRADWTTDDVEKLTRKEPQSIKVWFEDNEQDFVPRQREFCNHSRDYRCDYCRRDSDYNERRIFPSRM